MDYPRDVETYMHRVGRSGRYGMYDTPYAPTIYSLTSYYSLGTSGIAVNLVASRDEQFLEQLKERGLHILPLPGMISCNWNDIHPC